MVKKSKKISITTESREIFILHASGKNAFCRFCSECRAETEILTLDQAVSLSKLSAREIVRRVEAGELNFWETDSGHIFFCRECLTDSAVHQTSNKELGNYVG